MFVDTNDLTEIKIYYKRSGKHYNVLPTASYDVLGEEDKKKYKLPKYITTKELEELMNSDEMRKLVKQLEMIEEYKQKTQDISIGEY